MKPIWLILKPGISAGSANGTGPLPPRGPRKILCKKNPLSRGARLRHVPSPVAIIGQSLRNRIVLVNLPVSPAQSTSGPFILSAPPQRRRVRVGVPASSILDFRRAPSLGLAGHGAEPQLSYQAGGLGFRLVPVGEERELEWLALLINPPGRKKPGTGWICNSCPSTGREHVDSLMHVVTELAQQS